MRWSWRLGTLAGIGVYVHATFLILLAWVAYAHIRAGESAAQVAGGLLFILALFACVVLHELGHALAARRYGIRTRDITLLPIGGVARLERIPDEPKQELVVALAGPAVNVLIAAALWAVLFVTNTLVPYERLGVAAGPALERLLAVNVILVVFNMIPAFPMDGGRVLRALLATRLDHARATQIAARIGQFLALAFGFLGLLYNPFLIFIALFVWMGAAQEAGLASVRSALGGVPASHVMVTEFHSLGPDATLADAVTLTLAGSQKDFPVMEGGRVLGVLRQRDLVAGLSEHGPGVAVRTVMSSDVCVVESGEMVEEVFTRLASGECQTAPVVRRGEVVGLLTLENVGEFLRIHEAMRAAGRTSRPLPPLP